jgi:SAM-dependent methyltransferase
MTRPADEALAAIVARCARGELGPPAALGRLIAAARDLGAVERALDPPSPAARELRRLLDRHRPGIAQALAILAAADAAAAPAASLEDGLAGLARLFDGAVGTDPAASVALHSLGDPDLLAAATAEAAALMERLGVAAPGRDLLDLGCGTGRFELALAPRVASVTGLDLSPAMVAAARERCAGLANVRLLATDGRDLRPFPDASFDAVIAVDSFPYLYQAGGPAFVEAQLREARRVLRPRGDILVMNLSYRGDPGLDRADARAFAAELGLELLRDGTADLTSWDGLTFHFREAG